MTKMLSAVTLGKKGGGRTFGGGLTIERVWLLCLSGTIGED